MSHGFTSLFICTGKQLDYRVKDKIWNLMSSRESINYCGAKRKKGKESIVFFVSEP